MKLAFWIVVGLCAAVSDSAAQDPVDWSIVRVSPPALLRPGSTVSVKLTAKIEDGWHIYSISQGPGGPVPSRISLPTGQPFTVAGEIKASEPEMKFDQNFGIDVEYHEGEATFTLPIRIASTAQSGSKDLLVNARYQACNAEVCLPARTKQLKLSLNIRDRTEK